MHPHHLYRLTIVFAIICMAKDGAYAQSDTFQLHADVPYLHRKDIILKLYYSSGRDFIGHVNVLIYKIVDDSDSVVILKKSGYRSKFKNGYHSIKLRFSPGRSESSFCNTKYYEIFTRVGSVPPGEYVMVLEALDSPLVFHSNSYHQIDSNLDGRSPLRHQINKDIARRPSVRGRQITSPPVGVVLKTSQGRIERKIRKSGLTSAYQERNDKLYINVFFQDWFAGRYETNKDERITSHLNGQTSRYVPGQNFSNAPIALERPSLFSIHKASNSKEQEEMNGMLGLTTNASTGQEPNSTMDNNYCEVRTALEMPVMGIPVEVQGFYTTQDASRKIKASYIHVHYDVNKVRDGIVRSISSYNKSYAENKSRMVGLQQVYGSSLSRLESERANLTNTPDLPSVGSGQSKKDQLAVLDRKIAKYKTLLEQSKRTELFDSAMVFSRTKDINGNDFTNKQLLNRGSELFPDGRAKKFVSGLKTVDVGMFPKAESKHTMNGQMLKGADVAYEFGSYEAGATVGKTEYIGRDGNTDKYTCYAGRISYMPIRSQKVSFVYYGYSLDRSVFSKDGFWGNVNVSAPTFLKPVHILSANYTGTISNNINITGEVASSFQQSDSVSLVKHVTDGKKDNRAFDIGMDATIPKTTVTIESSYRKTGKDFVNNTLPLAMSGTEQYRMAVRNDFFRSFLTVGVEFNKLVQQSTFSSGNSTKWGFDIKTNSQRYPTIAVSYKPFSTFRSNSDTLAIPQKPMFGAVWTARAGYQFKKNNKTWRYSVLYNDCSTHADTTKYRSKSVQALTGYLGKRWSHLLTIGAMLTEGTASTQSMPVKSRFIIVSTSYSLSKATTVAAGQEVGFATFGLSRMSPNLSVTHQFKRTPIQLRVNVRFNSFKFKEQDPWTELYSGMIDLAYRFRKKIPPRNQ